MKKLGVGVIGLGWNGLLFCEKYKSNPKSELIAVCDKDPERMEAAAVRFEVQGYQDYGILEDERIQVISIHTPDHLHTEPFIKALEAGKHVFVEKPLAYNLTDLKTMLEASQKYSGQVKLVGQILRFGNYFGAVKKWVDSGVLGEICYAECDYIHDLRYQRFLEKWKIEKEIPMLGGGIHALDIVRWVIGGVCGEIKEVTALSNHISYKEMKEDTAIAASFQFENGAVCKISTIYGCPAPRPFGFNLCVYGTKGSVVRDCLCMDGTGEESMTIPHSIYDPSFDFMPEVEHFLDCIQKNDTNTRATVEDAAMSVLGALFATRASVEGKILQLPTVKEFVEG